MRVVFSLLIFSATMFFSSVVLASDLLIPPTYCVKETGPGLYLRFDDGGALTARLSLSSENKVKGENGHKVDGAERFSFFLGPELGAIHNDMSSNIAAGKPAVDTYSDSKIGADYGVHCGFTWKFK